MQRIRIKELFRSVIHYNRMIYGLYSVVKMIIKDSPLIFYEVLYSTRPIKNNKIVFSSFNGQSYNAQPKSICDSLKNHERLDIVWILPDQLASSCPYRHVPPDSPSAVYELMTAKVWVDNCRKKFWLKKRKNQFYIQTWHGPVCLKAVEKDAKKTLPRYYVKSAIRDSRNANYIVSECRWRTKNIYNSFWYGGELLKAEFKPSTNSIRARKKVCAAFGISEKTKIALYVPTFREDGSTSAYLSEYDSLLEALSIRFPGDWIVIVRMHPNVTYKDDFIGYSDAVKNGTGYSSVEELIYSSEFVITDYSGCIFEAFRAKKMVQLFALDFENYVKADRMLYFDIEKLPSPLARSEDELVSLISSFDVSKYETERQKLVDRLGYYKSNAAEVCKEQILKHINGGIQL